MIPTIPHKHGDTFSKTCSYLRNGEAYNLTGAVIVADIRAPDGTLVETVTATLLTQSGVTLGKFTLVVPYASTEAWPVDQLRFDIQYTFPDGLRISTKTIYLNEEPDVTT